MNGTLHHYAVRVYYEDTDLSGITYHANYLRWFERARSDLLVRLGIDQRAAIEDGTGAYAVADMTIKYLRPARLDDDVLIETRCTQLRAASCRMHQMATRGPGMGGERAVRSRTCASASSRPMAARSAQPEAWRDAFTRFLSPEATHSTMNDLPDPRLGVAARQRPPGSIRWNCSSMPISWCRR